MDSDLSNKQSSLVPPFSRDSRGSLEVFSPSNYSLRPTNPVFQSSSSWQSSEEARSKLKQVKEEDSKLQTNSSLSKPDEITSWMALPDPPPVVYKSIPAIPTSKDVDHQLKLKDSSSAKAEKRAAEWGLVLNTDDETGKPQGVSVRSSGGDEPNPKPDNLRRESGGSVRSSGDSSDGGFNRNIPRVSEDLKDALSAFQQTFVVSDASKADYPIMYASEGFFKMTGYTSREVIGRNCRFLQGAETDSNELEKIREALGKGNNYCGRLLNYKKDGTPFWNLLTIAPIKDEAGKVLKYIGMQVEVSEHTEGSKDKMIRPNGLPESLIRYDARQKDLATSSVNELVQAVKRPRARSESGNRPFRRKSDVAHEKERPQSQMRRRSENMPPFRRLSLERLSEVPEKKLKKSRRRSFMGILKKSKTKEELINDGETFDDKGCTDNEDYDFNYDDVRPDSVDDKVRKKEMRKGIDLATTLERIEKNFVITDPRLPDNPIIFASDSFLELTEYSREEILGRNCRFLQGHETDPETVHKIRVAIDNETEVTVQLINYTKTGKKFWNVFHLQPMRDQKGEVQYFIGVQLDGSQHVEPLQNSIPVAAVNEGEKLVKETAQNVDVAARELPDANKKPEDLWANHSKIVQPKPHRKDSASWNAIRKVKENGEPIGLNHFKPVRPLGSGDTGSVHLVELRGTGEYFAMKAMDKSAMLTRNKVHRACAEREILSMLDHPFLPALYASFQTKTHICLITDYCPGGELFLLLDKQPTKVLKEDAVRFYAAEVIVALEYLHCQGIIYRDLKPENILIQDNGHIALTDFDLSCLTSCMPQLLLPENSEKKRQHKAQQIPFFLAEPMRASNSFVGTEEYIAPEIIGGVGHTSAVDWLALGILLYEMLYGFTPFRGKTRQRTFTNVLQKSIKFPSNKPVSLQAKQLIYQLLQRDPKNRLGAYEGANEIKRHPFFRGVNWALIRCMVSAAILFEAGILSCLDYLESVPWSEDEEEKIISCLSQLQLHDSVSEDVLQRVTTEPSTSTRADDMFMKMLTGVLQAKDEKARREMKALISRLLREDVAEYSNYAPKIDVSRDTLYTLCHRCLSALILCLSEATCMDESRQDRGALMAEIAREADNMQWIVDILIDKKMGDEFVNLWADQKELATLHSKIPTMYRHEISRVTAQLCIAIGRGHILVPKETRYSLLSTWLEPLYEDFGWMKRASRFVDKKVVEDGLSQTILTLPISQQQSILMSWFDRFLTKGDDCPNIQKAFEIWWRRAFIRQYAPDHDQHMQITVCDYTD